MKIYFPALSVLILLAACNTEEIGKSKDVNPDSVYSEYTINDNEVSDEALARARFRFGGPEGTTLLLSDSEYVSLDGAKIVADSTKSMGVYYETKKTPASFSGSHTWVFSNRNGKQFTNTFNFAPVRVSNAIPAKISMKDFVLQLSGVTDSMKIEVNVSDTASKTDDLEINAIGKSAVTIPGASLAKLKPGPITIDIMATERHSLKSTTPEGGEFVIYHDLKAKKTSLQQ